ncbi:MAG: hypothetical protein ACK5ME_10625 [Parahaliea sp.]
MPRNRRKTKGRGGDAGFGALPRAVWEHPDYCKLSGSAVKLLMDLACQYNGRNNGDLTVAYSILKKRGWSSKDTITNAKDRLLEAGLIICTREGRFTNPGGECALYALAWKPINDCPDRRLAVAPTNTPPRKFSLEIIKPPGPETGPGAPRKPGR